MAAITNHPAFPQPPEPNVELWRYMDLGKFVWMLQRRALFFARSDKLGDPYEGYYTELNAIIAEQEHFAQTQEISRVLGVKFDPVQDKESFRSMLRILVDKRVYYFVSCWHMNDEESAAMWKIYTNQNESIGVKSTYHKLCAALPDETFIGEVHYINYKRESVEGAIPGFGVAHAGLPLKLIMHKRQSYAHEKEIRAVLWSEQPETSTKYKEQNGGLVVPIDLSHVIDQVYISPTASPMLKEIVDGLLEKYDLKMECLQSGINAPPTY